LRHLLVMVTFAAFVAIAFGVIGREGKRESLLYGLKIFGEFVLIGLLLAWLLYWLPF
jgi:hypothetical protein